jgi:hypothetical protein
MTVIPGDSDSEVIPAGRLVHVGHCRQKSDILGARWPSPAHDLPTRLPSRGRPSAASATVVIERRPCPCCGGERPDPG